MASKALSQYLDLWRDHSATIDAHSHPLLRRGAEGAFSRLAEAEADAALAEIYGPDRGLNLTRLPLADPAAAAAAAFRCDVPGISTLAATVVADTFVPGAALESRLPQGVTFCSLRRAAEHSPALVERYLGRIAGGIGADINSLLLQDGVMIHLDKGVCLDKPLQLTNIFATTPGVMAIRRVVIALEEGARARILMCDHTQADAPGCMAQQVTEIYLGRGAELDVADIEESAAEGCRHALTFVTQGEGSRLNHNVSTLTCGHSVNELSLRLEGERCESLLTAMVIADGRMRVDHRTLISHEASRCHSRQLYKYVLSDSARGSFDGLIKVQPGAVKTEAYQSNRNILASASARMHSEPQLEIYNDDVKCSHGATTGQLDQEALFYMRTRGIPQAQARTMLMQAFMADITDTIAIPGLQERLRRLVDRRLGGECASGCSHCHSEEGAQQV